MPPSSSGFRFPTLARRLVPLAALALAIVLLRAPLLRLAAAPLVVAASEEEPVDALLLAWGDRRAEVAGRWFREGKAQQALLLRWPDTRAVQLGSARPGWWGEMRALVEQGVPRNRIEVLEPAVMNHWDIALALGSRLSESPGLSVGVLCPELGCAGLAAAMRRALGERSASLSWFPLPDRRFTHADWWHDKHGVLAFFYSWTQRIHPWIFGDQPSEFELWDPEEWLREETGGRSPGTLEATETPLAPLSRRREPGESRSIQRAGRGGP